MKIITSIDGIEYEAAFIVRSLEETAKIDYPDERKVYMAHGNIGIVFILTVKSETN